MSVTELVRQWEVGRGGHLSEQQVRDLLGAAGIPVGEPVAPGVELRLAIEPDPLFGRVIAFSYGRMAMDVWDDVTYRIVPLAPKDARQMVYEPKAAATLLKGYGGRQAPDAAAITETLLKLSRLAEEAPQIGSLELDPVFASSDGIVVKSARGVVWP